MSEAMIPMYEMLVPITLVSLFVALIACLIGLKFDEFHENWFQHLGMAATALGSMLKILQIYGRGRVTFETALLAVGVALFAVGFAYRVWQTRHIPRPPTPPRAYGKDRETA